MPDTLETEEGVSTGVEVIVFMTAAFTTEIAVLVCVAMVVFVINRVE